MKKDLTLPTLASIVALLAFSSVGATYAWYQYNANVVIDYNGTSIGSSTVFEVGLVSETPLIGYDEYGLVREEIDGKDVYWCSSEVTPNISKYYLNSNGYATNYLNGVTSGKYKEGDQFKLKRNLTYKNNYYDVFDKDDPYRYAEKENYAHFSLAFKVNVISPDNEQIVEKSRVSLKTYDLSSDGDLLQSVRMHFSSDVCSFVFNPTETENGKTTVGGVLDLNNDGVYDTFTDTRGTYEYIYGEYESSVYKENKSDSGAYPSALSGTGNSFVAEHRDGVYALDVEKSVLSTCEYSGRKQVIDGKRTLAETDENGNAFLEMDVYLEGWDSTFIDLEMNHMFSLGLEFECK